MTALTALCVSIILALNGGGWPVAVPVVVLVAAVAGTTFPDLDQLLPLGHRSALTHSILPVVLAAGYDRRLWPVAAGLGLGLGLHLAADLFPNSMRGYATIKVPLLGSIGAWSSYLWIAANAGLALVGGAWLLGQVAVPRVALATIAAVGAIGFAYLFRTDGGWWAILLFALVGWVMWRWG